MAPCYNNWVRPRWHDWVIVLAITTLAVIGIASIWGDDLQRLWRGPAPAQGSSPAVTPAGPAGAL